MNKEDREIVRSLEKLASEIYWDLCSGKDKCAIGKVAALQFRLAKLRGYEGD